MAVVRPTPAHVVTAATDDYLATQDTLGLWLDEKCVTHDTAAETHSADLYASFKEWKESRGERAPSQKGFTEQLDGRFHRERCSRTGRMVFRGVRLK